MLTNHSWFIRSHNSDQNYDYLGNNSGISLNIELQVYNTMVFGLLGLLSLPLNNQSCPFTLYSSSRIIRLRALKIASPPIALTDVFQLGNPQEAIFASEVEVLGSSGNKRYPRMAQYRSARNTRCGGTKTYSTPPPTGQTTGPKWTIFGRDTP